MKSQASPQVHAPFASIIDAVESVKTDRFSMEQALGLLGDRSFAGVMVALGLPALFMPPGVAALLGLPLVLICAQMLFARPEPWIPRTVKLRSIQTAHAVKIARRLGPIIDHHRRYLRPRLGVLFGPVHERLIALICTAMSVVLITPAPFAHAAAGLSVASFGAGLIRKDGLALLAGWAFAVVCLAVVALEVGGAIYGVRLI